MLHIRKMLRKNICFLSHVFILHFIYFTSIGHEASNNHLSPNMGFITVNLNNWKHIFILLCLSSYHNCIYHPCAFTRDRRVVFFVYCSNFPSITKMLLIPNLNTSWCYARKLETWLFAEGTSRNECQTA